MEFGLYLHEVFVSAKRSELPMTVFVGATLERLAALEAQCRSYPGPLSAAIYVPLLQIQHGPQLTSENSDVLAKATASIRKVFESFEFGTTISTSATTSPSSSSTSPTHTTATAPGTSSCALTVLLLYEVVADPPLAGLVPINTLRNAALLAASTPLVAMIDVDLAPSESLGAEVLRPLRLGGGGGGGGSVSELLRTCSQQRAVWVLPAWETHKRLGREEGTRVAQMALSGDKVTLRRFQADELIHYFAKLAYARGHAATNFSRWLDSDVPYTVPYEVNYEPWFIGSRALMPPYDVRFRGYGWNKVRVWQGVSASVGRLFHRRVSALRHVSIRDMRRGTYVAAVDPQIRHCRGVSSGPDGV
ncbi:hypothetical protein VOLCADRAFT_94735 [Volvox carteri f. nagariensis]|uniref:Uncharacterized protein n=1 Tax=Volvox carteri f. nagariensis TaxID=3068 RepID=D8U5L5_VOLCA|nr:uncharacterized protein VOLCADRAFT_94735 [Volvox carteri f. nagariensis]EFJ45024.1 hypothetical protein VOLCADRAFT_94735 [Volvox carteri f. nagariensis]|eukprot:XP_002953995.1 hypothetical protein VOLCADRAFT_94735 [Volvox carteri f. nagariensis]